jgi:hypothetical protein
MTDFEYSADGFKPALTRAFLHAVQAENEYSEGKSAISGSDARLVMA